MYRPLSQVDARDQDEATRWYLFRVLRDFRRAGVDKDPATRARVRALNEELKAALVTRTLPWDDFLDVSGRTRTVFIDTGKIRTYNEAMPGPLDISPDEVARRAKRP